jgi:hypothetical protein
MIYNIFYWAYQPIILCSFLGLDEAMKALKDLNKRYPDSKIYIEPASIMSYDEFLVKTGAKIQAYEQRPDVLKVD